MRCKCIVCGALAYGWFCEPCAAVKEQAYAEARSLGLSSWLDVLALRDERLAQHAARAE